MTREEVLERELLAQPVRSLQHMLQQLSKVYEWMPFVVVDGNFGEETLEAVMLFQRELHPPVTGVVDRGTWNAIRDAWYEAEHQLAQARAVRAYPSGGADVEEGMEREFMVLPQTMFQLLGRYLEGVQLHPADGRHGEASAQNVRWLQRAAGLKQTGVMDRQTWNILSRLYEVFVVQSLESKYPPFTGGWG